MNNLSIRNSHPIGKAVIFFTFCLFSLIIGSLLTNGLMEILNISIESKLGLQLMTFIGQLTGFILPAILFIVVFGRDSVGGFHLNSTSPIYWVLTFLLAVSAMGIVAYSGEINLKILEGRGGFIAELKKLEDQAALTTETMLEMKNIGQLLLNLFLVAVVPAICEELAFRGVLQSQLAKSFKNIHLAIWVTAIIFSAIHFQFFGFLPRMVLGAIFGYVLIYSGSIWMPILAHFINNSIGVLGYYIAQNTDWLTKEQIESTEVGWITVVVSIIIVGAIMYLMKKNSDWEERKEAYEYYSTNMTQLNLPDDQ